MKHIRAAVGGSSATQEPEWTDLISSSPFVKMRMKHTRLKGGENKSAGLGNAEVIVDCSSKEATCWLSHYHSRERMRVHEEERNPARLVITQTSPHDRVFATIKRMPLLLWNREFIMRVLATQEVETGDFLVCIQSVDEAVDYGSTFRTVRGTTTAFLRVSSLGDSQCEVVLYQYLEAGGIVPIRVENSKIPLSLSVLQDLREEFQRDEEVDKEEVDEMALVIRDEPQVNSEKEEMAIRRLQVRLGGIEEEQFKELVSPDPLVKMGMHYIQGNSGYSTGVARASAVIDASIEECAARELSVLSR
jgi:hypothetical protein